MLALEACLSSLNNSWQIPLLYHEYVDKGWCSNFSHRKSHYHRLIVRYNRVAAAAADATTQKFRISKAKTMLYMYQRTTTLSPLPKTDRINRLSSSIKIRDPFRSHSFIVTHTLEPKSSRTEKFEFSRQILRIAEKDLVSPEIREIVHQIVVANQVWIDLGKVAFFTESRWLDPEWCSKNFELNLLENCQSVA